MGIGGSGGVFRPPQPMPKSGILSSPALDYSIMSRRRYKGENLWSKPVVTGTTPGYISRTG